jgi:polyisoprenoid-binding protein YceI
VELVGPERAVVEILVFREGLLAAAGHDLALRATAFELQLDLAAPSVAARFDAASLRVHVALRDGRPLPGALSPRDVREIEKTIATTVLQARRFPEIRFASTAVSAEGDGWTIDGTLALAGVERAVRVNARREGERLVASTVLHQPDFGIRPYTAMLGALRVKPDVGVTLTVTAPSA